MRSWKTILERLCPYGIFAFFLCAFFWGMNASYPSLGHDFYNFFPRMLVGRWHALNQGVAPLRYAPQLCGGFPVYGDPHDIYYSLPQLLSFFVSLWTAVQLSIAFALIVGYAGWYRFGRDITGLKQPYAHLLAIVVLANGYYFMHMVVGHLSYHTVAFIGWFLWLLYHPRRDTLRASVGNATAFGMLSAYALYSAGYFPLILAAEASLLLLPPLLMFSGKTWPSRLACIARRVPLFLATSFSLCASKLIAIVSLLRFLPRTISFDRFPEGSSGIVFILKAFFAFPQGDYLLEPSQNKWGIHEYSMFLSPIVLLGLCIAALQFVRQRKQLGSARLLLFSFYALGVMVFFSELTIGKGLTVDWLKALPVFSSLRVTVRFLYGPAILMSIAAVIALERFFQHPRIIKFAMWAPALMSLLTIIAFIGAYKPMLDSPQLLLSVPYDKVLRNVGESHYLSEAITQVHILPAAMPSDLQSVLSASTSPGCYQPLLADINFRQPLNEGPVTEMHDGFFNIYDPSCMQYPAENHCKPGDRIRATDGTNLRNFINGLPVTWKLSRSQHLADILTVLGMTGSFFVALFALVQKRSSIGAQWKILLGSDVGRLVRSSIVRAAHSTRSTMLRRYPSNTEGFRRFLIVCLLVIGAAFVASLCAFKILDRDFWWHITAGEIIWRTGHLMQMEPFSYARAGLPYLANHEWLAQIILYLLFVKGGSTAVILLRTAAMLACLGFILLIDRKGIWLSVPLAIFAANAMRPAFIERPQLFTFVIFSAFLLLTFRFLDRSQQQKISSRTWKRLISTLCVLQILWVNLHGAACIIGLLFPAALLAEWGWQWWRHPDIRQELEREMRWIGALGVVLVVSVLITPTTYHNLTYIWSLFSDRTIIYIGEWQPSPLSVYLRYIGPLWIIATLSIILGRKNIPACVVILLATGYLSMQALRHEVLFVLAAFAVSVHQLKFSALWQNFANGLLRYRNACLVGLVIVLLCLAQYTVVLFKNFTRPDQLQGYGTFDFGRSAGDFLDHEHINGNMFNTYGIGGYLIYRGWPHGSGTGEKPQIKRPNFIDGRNVDYGFAFMNLTYLAGKDPVQWGKLDQKYGFTYAVIDYFANEDKKKNILYYANILENDPHWSLVYIDDWVAVYLKDVTENHAVIDRRGFKLLTASNLEFGNVLDTTEPSQFPDLERELRRAASDDQRSIKARLLLAKLLIREHRLDDAQVVVQDASIARPGMPEPQALFAAIATDQGKWNEAAEFLDRALALAGGDYPNIDYAMVFQVYIKAGRISDAKRFLRRIPAPDRQIRTDSGTVPAAASGAEMIPMINPGQDAIDFENKALQFAEEGKNNEARDNFLIALKLNPSYAQAWNNLGTLSFFEGKTDEARSEYERALTEFPDYPDAEYNLALLLLKTGHLAEAQPHIKRATTLGKDTAELRKMSKNLSQKRSY